MFFHDFGKNLHKGDGMSSATIQMAEELIRRERIISGRNKPEAIAEVARRASVTPGQLEGAIRGRVKDLKGRFIERIRIAFIQETTREIGRLTHDLQIAGESGLAPDDRAVVAAKAAIAKLEAALGGLSA
jgi:hypothetical protein